MIESFILLIAFLIDTEEYLQLKTDGVVGLPACLLPITTDGVSSAGASMTHEEEFPIIKLECLIRLMKVSLPADFINNDI